MKFEKQNNRLLVVLYVRIGRLLWSICCALLSLKLYRFSILMLYYRFRQCIVIKHHPRARVVMCPVDLVGSD
jgi:hypothetical protein